MNQRKRKRHLSRGRGRYWGKRCPEYFEGCICCEAWKFYDETGRFPSFDEAHERCNEANRRELQAILDKYVDDRGNLMSPAGLVNDIRGLL